MRIELSTSFLATFGIYLKKIHFHHFRVVAEWVVDLWACGLLGACELLGLVGYGGLVSYWGLVGYWGFVGYWGLWALVDVALYMYMTD